jgi:hypothetical protein
VNGKLRTTSYSQNLEDVVLSRLIDLIDHGTYIDIGAGHPVLENATYTLYLAGWTGINVEPMAREAQLLVEQRPRDITLQVAVGGESGRITLFEAPLENRGATTWDSELVARYEAAGQKFTPFEVELVTLDAILSRFEPGQVHVLKVDVEGMEDIVIANANLAKHQPWVLVIESTVPNSVEQSHHAWEHVVLDAGYVMTLFDGLNRFYVRNDLDEIVSVLSTPANVFDFWESYAVQFHKDREAVAREYAESLEAELQLFRDKAEIAETYCRSLEADRLLLRDRLDQAEVYNRSLESERVELREGNRAAAEYAHSLEADREQIRATMESSRSLLNKIDSRLRAIARRFRSSK